MKDEQKISDQMHAIEESAKNVETKSAKPKETQATHAELNETQTTHAELNETQTTHAELNETQTAHAELNETQTAHAELNLFDGVFMIPIYLPPGAHFTNNKPLPVPPGTKYVLFQPEFWK